MQYSFVGTVKKFREWTCEMVAREYADVIESGKVANGFASVIEWNKNFFDKLQELKNDEENRVE